MRKGDGQHVHVQILVTLPDGTEQRYASFFDPRWDSGSWRLAGAVPVSIAIRTGDTRT